MSFLFSCLRLETIVPFVLTLSRSVLLRKQFEDTKRAIRSLNFKEGQKTQIKERKDKQWSTKHTHKTKDRATRAPFTGDWG
jgi:hypothetical protein